MQTHEFSLRRYVLLSALLLVLIGFIAFVGFQKPSITGAFIVGNQYFSNNANVSVNSTAQVVDANVKFLPENYRPVDLEDCKSAYILAGSNVISNFNVTLEQETGICKSLNLTFSNIIFDTNQTGIVYEIYYGKSLQRINFVSPTPADKQILNETNTTTIMAELSLPEVARLKWGSNIEAMTGNGSSWWATKTNLANGNYTFRVITEKVASESRTFEVNYIPQQQGQQNQTNQTPSQTEQINFVSPTPKNNSVLNSKNFTVVVNSTSEPALGFDSNGSITNYATQFVNSLLWQKTFENLENGIYKFRAYTNSSSTETRIVQINYTPPQPELIKEIEIDFTIENTPPSKDVSFVIPIKNSGNVEISSVSAIVDVYQSGNFLQTLDLGSVPNISVGENGQLSASWVAPEFDKYSAEAKINWDAGSKILTKNFTIGEPLIEITKFSREQTSDVEATLTAELTNRWVELISVSLKFNIYNSSSQINSLDAGKQDIAAKESKSYSAKLQTEDVSTLKIETVASYLDKTTASSLEAILPAAKTVEQISKESKIAGSFAKITGAFSKLREKKTGGIAILVSAMLFALILVFLIAARKPKDPVEAYMEEYYRRVKGWQDYYNRRR